MLPTNIPRCTHFTAIVTRFVSIHVNSQVVGLYTKANLQIPIFKDEHLISFSHEHCI